MIITCRTEDAAKHTKAGRTTLWDVLRNVELPHRGGGAVYDVNRPYGRAHRNGTAAYSARYRRAPVNSEIERPAD